MDAKQAFLCAIERAGLIPPKEIIADKCVHRFNANGKRFNRSGWYVLHDNGHSYVGSFGDWRTRLKVDWHDKTEKPLTHAEVKASKERLHREQIDREAKKEKAQAIARNEIKKVWEKALPADESHPYLVRKQIAPYNARQLGDKLVIPVFKDGQLTSLQYINHHGGKYFHKGSTYMSGFGLIGNLTSPSSSKICIAEGFATAASVYEATGFTTVIAFSANNLMNVARRVFLWINGSPNKRIKDLIVLGDDDITPADIKAGPVLQVGNVTNAGREAALKVREELGLAVVFPHFSNPDLIGTDFNDLHVFEGIEAVETCIHSQLNNRVIS